MLCGQRCMADSGGLYENWGRRCGKHVYTNGLGTLGSTAHTTPYPEVKHDV